MYIEKVCVNDFKNLSEVNIDLGKNLNILFGENAEGKTNFLESVWLCGGCKSFRGTKDKDLINFEKNIANVGLNFHNSYRKNSVKFTLNKENILDKKIELNKVSVPSFTKIFGELEIVIFTPDDLCLAKGAPADRRFFCDLSISQIKTDFYKSLNKYDNVLSQRNSLVKSFKNSYPDLVSLDTWDFQLANLGAFIALYRYNYCKCLSEIASKLYNEMTEGEESLEITYESTILKNLEGRKTYRGVLSTDYLDALRKALDNDLKMGFTTVGVHRDDILIKINDKPTRNICSQGQARSAALVMKIAQALLCFKETGEYPVLMLDDVLSELDERRQGFILNNIKDIQVLLTTCDEKVVSNIKKENAKLFYVKDGIISERKI